MAGQYTLNDFFKKELRKSNFRSQNRKFLNSCSLERKMFYNSNNFTEFVSILELPIVGQDSFKG